MILGGVVQSAVESAGSGKPSGIPISAGVTLDNQGTLSITASAKDSAIHAAAAAATIWGGIEQGAGAKAGEASVMLTNSGDLTLAAIAQATGSMLAQSGGDMDQDAFRRHL